MISCRHPFPRIFISIEREKRYVGWHLLQFNQNGKWKNGNSQFASDYDLLRLQRGDMARYGNTMYVELNVQLFTRFNKN